MLGVCMFEILLLLQRLCMKDNLADFHKAETISKILTFLQSHEKGKIKNKRWLTSWIVFIIFIIVCDIMLQADQEEL